MEADEDNASKEEEDDEATEEAVKGRPDPACGAIEEEGRHISGLVSAAMCGRETNKQRNEKDYEYGDALSIWR